MYPVSCALWNARVQIPDGLISHMRSQKFVNALNFQCCLQGTVNKIRISPIACTSQYHCSGVIRMSISKHLVPPNTCINSLFDVIWISGDYFLWKLIVHWLSFGVETDCALIVYLYFPFQFVVHLCLHSLGVIYGSVARAGLYVIAQRSKCAHTPVGPGITCLRWAMHRGRTRHANVKIFKIQNYTCPCRNK